MKKLEVYGGMALHGWGQERAICAVTCRAEAARLADMPAAYVRNYWCITKNQEEVAQALASPHTLIWTGKR